MNDDDDDNHHHQTNSDDDQGHDCKNGNENLHDSRNDDADTAAAAELNKEAAEKDELIQRLEQGRGWGGEGGSREGSPPPTSPPKSRESLLQALQSHTAPIKRHTRKMEFVSLLDYDASADDEDLDLLFGMA